VPAKAVIRAIEYHLPEHIVANATLAEQFPEWTADKIVQKTGIEKRHVSAEGELSSDLGVLAAQKLFSSEVVQPKDIDYLLLCTQSPDYFLPTTACLMQDRLGIPTNSGALDFNLGCSGFVYGLGLAKGLIETGQAANVLLITAETYSKFIQPNDKGNRTLFGDAAAATLIQSSPDLSGTEHLGPFSWGTDGSGGDNLIVKYGGLRNPVGRDTRDMPELYMNGSEIFSFTLRIVPEIVNDLLKKTDLSLPDIDLFVFHQANQYMLDHLRKKMGIPKEKFALRLSACGNTVSSTIPIALKELMNEDLLQDGQRIMLVGFGVGYSWGAAMIRWQM
jgi:3-oxoacyl-[acyl-carrier-protein] synthase-3